MHQIEICRLQFFGDGTTATITDGSIIQFSNGCHFCCSTRKERLVRYIHFISGDTLFLNGDSKIIRKNPKVVVGSSDTV